ncbi:hypothetical protein CFOL_v3_29812 [Cephalotus follicularis]|uniref:Uncharacterized protein n=1 Tax=Cephalotus follicularis TaxID=3775 RepID=A0A1Q3D1U5_CEPFO|nr:hypothetical protein CFOL_v3_29812 [Cephalotus follicularis]
MAKNNGAFATLSDEAELGSEVIGGVESEQPRDWTSNAETNDSKVTKSEEVAEPSKNKKKKKKSGIIAQEEDDLDKILPISTLYALPAQYEKVLLSATACTEAYVGGEKEVEKETVESTAAKKKKKKKEK